MTDKPLGDVWISRDLPVLSSITRRIDGGEQFVDPSVIAGELGMTEEQVDLAGRALIRRGLIAEIADYEGTQYTDVSGEAYLLTGLHPDGQSALDRLADTLRQAIERTNDPDDKRALRRVKDSLLDAPGGVIGSVLTAFITSGIGG